MERKELKEVIEEVKEFMFNHDYESAPYFSDLKKEFDLSFEEYNKILEAIGREKEAEGYELDWNVYDEFGNSKDFRKFVVKKYPNERDLTKEEEEIVARYLISKYGPWGAIEVTQGFDLVTDDFIIWVRGLREGDWPFWHWDEINSEI